MGKSNTFNIGDRVQITPDYYDQTLQGRRGTIGLLPDKDHPDGYLVVLDEGPLHGRGVWIPAMCLQKA